MAHLLISNYFYTTTKKYLHVMSSLTKILIIQTMSKSNFSISKNLISKHNSFSPPHIYIYIYLEENVISKCLYNLSYFVIYTRV